MRKLLIAAVLSAGFFAPLPAFALNEAIEPPSVDYSFDGPFGTFDRDQLQRGYKVYKEVCSACHSMKFVAFRNLHDDGGPQFTEPEAKAFAASIDVPTIDDSGQPTTRKGTLADYFPSPFPNDAAAKSSNNGAIPPDLSLMAKAREGGPQYIHAILTGFGQKPPDGFTVPNGGYFNPYFAGHVIGMPPPLRDGQVDYDQKEIPQTVDQYAKDVSAFLMWTAEPKLEVRHRLGMGVIIALAILAVLFYLSYRRVWRNVDH